MAKEFEAPTGSNQMLEGASWGVFEVVSNLGAI